MQRMKRICALTVAILELAAVLLMFGTAPTQARYENTQTWRGVYGTDTVVIQSNFLTSANQTNLLAETEPVQTNLLYDWTMSGTSSRQYEIKLFSNAENIQAELTCKGSEYLQAVLDQTSLILPTSGDDAIILTLTPTEKALEITEPVTVTLTVQAVCQPVQMAENRAEGADTTETAEPEILTGVFQVTLIPEEIVPEETEPTETTVPPETTEPTEAPTEPATEPTGDDASDDTLISTEPTVNASEPEETQAVTGQTSETTYALEDTAGEAEETTPDPSTAVQAAAEEETVPATEPPSGKLDVNAPTAFAKAEPVNWEITVSDNTDQIVISADIDYMTGLRYQIDNGTWIMLADGGDIVIDDPASQMTLTMDFAWVGSVSEVDFDITTYTEGYQLCYMLLSMSCSKNPLTLDLDGVQSVIQGKSTLSIRYSGEEEGWKWTLERLIRKDDGSVEYIPDESGTEYEQFGLKVTFNTSTGKLQISNASGSAPPGTYRIILEQKQQGTVISTVELPLFIHY